MRLVHMRSRKGRRGHKWFPGQSERFRLPTGFQLASLLSAILGAGRAR